MTETGKISLLASAQRLGESSQRRKMVCEQEATVERCNEDSGKGERDANGDGSRA